MEKYIQHHGVKGMHWGVRKEERLAGKIIGAENKVERNKARINKITTSYKGSKRAKRLEMKRAKYQMQKDRLAPKVNSIRAKMEAYGKNPGYFERKKLIKDYKLNTKIARIDRKQNLWKRKVDKLEYKNIKLEHKIEKYNKQLTKALSNSDITSGKEFLEKYRKSIEEYD